MHPETERTAATKTGDPGQSPCHSDAYPFPLDAVVLAGTHQNPKTINHRSQQGIPGSWWKDTDPLCGRCPVWMLKG